MGTHFRIYCEEGELFFFSFHLLFAFNLKNIYHRKRILQRL